MNTSPAISFCPSCGTEALSDARFCASCGREHSQLIPANIQAEPATIAGASNSDGELVARDWIDRTFSGGKPAFFGCLAMLLVIVSIVGLGIYAAVSAFTAPKPPEIVAQEASAAVEEKRKGFHCLSPIDGSHPDIVAQTKARLTDPDSFEQIETRITPANSAGYHQLLMLFRSRNGFGGMVQGRAIGSVNTRTCQGLLISVE